MKTWRGNPLAHLPNRDGFEFIGILADGSKIDCVVAFTCGRYSAYMVCQDTDTLEPIFHKLVGWEINYVRPL